MSYGISISVRKHYRPGGGADTSARLTIEIAINPVILFSQPNLDLLEVFGDGIYSPKCVGFRLVILFSCLDERILKMLLVHLQ
jgi:hypothetical protein